MHFNGSFYGYDVFTGFYIVATSEMVRPHHNKHFLFKNWHVLKYERNTTLNRFFYAAEIHLVMIHIVQYHFEHILENQTIFCAKLTIRWKCIAG